MSKGLKHDKITCVDSGTAVHSYIDQTFMLWFSTSNLDHTMDWDTDANARE